MPPSKEHQRHYLPTGDPVAYGSTLLSEALSRFPEEYDRIVRKYGAVEFILEGDGKVALLSGYMN